MPCLVVQVIFHFFPEMRGSPVSRAFNDTPRLTSFDWNTSSTAFARSSPLDSISMASPDQRMEESVFLKSKRCDTSLAAWFSALSTSWRSTLLTTSKELSAAMGSSSDRGAPIVPAPLGPSPRRSATRHPVASHPAS